MKLGDIWDRFGTGALPSSTVPARDLFIFGVTDNSREVRFGYLFCALPGATTNGLAYCAQAAALGAQAIAVPEETPDDAIGLSEYEQEKLVVLRVRDVRRFFAEIVQAFHPGRPQTLVAVTGTNGKTSTVSFLRDLWATAGRNALSLGTLGMRARNAIHTNLEAGLTTFDAKTLHIILGELASAHGVTHLAMEASSHALDQQRLAGLSFEAAGFTNLTQDHLDYHQTMEAYFASKLKLFTERLAPHGVAVVNLASTWGRRVAMAVAARGQGGTVIGFGNPGDRADLTLVGRMPHERGQTLQLQIEGAPFEVEAPVAGIFQAENILCAVGLAIATGVPVATAVAAVADLAPVPGRLERVAVLPNGASVYVDYAHTPDALENVLRSLRPHVGPGGSLHVVFGCGGDRDVKKRPIMGRIAAEQADRVWVTDDNPRTEDPIEIRRQVLAGVPRAVDAGPRREAIERALSAMGPGDVLVIAGKGHEDYQVVPAVEASGAYVRDAAGRIKTRKMPFSDQVVVRELLESGR